MATVWTEMRVVGIGGKIDLVVPGVSSGETVRVSVERQPDPTSQPAERPMGFLKGRVSMTADFDAPLDDFAEYMGP